MKHTRRTLIGMLAGLFAGWGAAKAAPAIRNSEVWTKELTGQWIRVVFTATGGQTGGTVTYELLNEDMMVILKTDGFASAAYAPSLWHARRVVRGLGTTGV